MTININQFGESVFSISTSFTPSTIESVSVHETEIFFESNEEEEKTLESPADFLSEKNENDDNFFHTQLPTNSDSKEVLPSVNLKNDDFTTQFDHQTSTCIWCEEDNSPDFGNLQMTETNYFMLSKTLVTTRTRTTRPKPRTPQEIPQVTSTQNPDTSSKQKNQKEDPKVLSGAILPSTPRKNNSKMIFPTINLAILMLFSTKILN